MARQLYQAIHQPPITQIPTSDSTYLLRQLSPPPSLPATQQSFALPTTMDTVAALHQPITLQSTQQPASLPSTQQPVASLAEPSTASLQLPPRSLSMQLPVTSLTQQSAASLQPLPLPVSASSSGSPDLALLFDQFIRYATSTQAAPSGQTAQQPSRQLPSKTVQQLLPRTCNFRCLILPQGQLSLLPPLTSNFYHPAHPISPSPVLCHFLAVSNYLSQLCLSSPSSCNYPSFSKPSHHGSSQPPQWHNILPQYCSLRCYSR